MEINLKSYDNFVFREFIADMRIVEEKTKVLKEQLKKEKNIAYVPKLENLVK